MMTSWLSCVCWNDGIRNPFHRYWRRTDPYAIAMALCKHIPLLINRDDIQELVGKYKRRIGKLIFDSYHALVETIKAWNNEEKRQEVCRYIKETAGQYPNHRGMKKKLMDLMPETPFEGEPMAVIREPNDMEKSLL